MIALYLLVFGVFVGMIFYIYSRLSRPSFTTRPMKDSSAGMVVRGAEVVSQGDAAKSLPASIRRKEE